MSSILLSLPDVYESYKRWVSSNPQASSDYETTAKWLSYFIAGRINNSHVVSELVYALSNLLVLYNDRIISQVRQIDIPSSGDRLKLWLTIIEYSEVFLELSAHKAWGNAGRWLVVVAIQVYKCISKLLLLYHHKETIIQNPPIPALQRQTLTSINSLQDPSVADVAQAQFEAFSFTLKRSGKTIRKVDGSPPTALRTWKPVERSSFDNEQTVEQALAGRQLVAETLYVVKPVIHLGAMACFGTRAWRPWVLSFLVDLASLHLYRSCRKAKVDSLSRKQKLQLSKRTVLLLMYLVRSPFYEKHSRDKINVLLTSLNNNVRLTGIICNPVMHYLPFWQSNYFYMWSS